MYLKSLTLKGFKSFARPVTFAFEPGVTCVVGPNGSGKSNVVDALAWVMGEQGVKSLRGGSMQDVIFAGTATRPALGRAHVMLTIDNSDGALPIDYSEVTISRTVFRGGGSEYAINGRSCRLLDVQELLSDSGLGRHMHVIVGQGKLDAVLAAGSQERRGLIEEAAGILKHRRRKENTLRKLEAMQANTDRVSDLVTEIRRRLKPLGRQAKLAAEARTVQAAVRAATARLLADDVETLQQQITAERRARTAQQGEAAAVDAELAGVRAAIRNLEDSARTAEFDAARSTLFALQACRDRVIGLDALVSQRLALLAEPEDAGPAATVITGDALREAEQRAAAAERDLAQAEEARRRARAELDERLRVAAAAQQELARVLDERRERELRNQSLLAKADVAASRAQAAREDLARRDRAAAEAEERAARAAAELAACPEPDAARAEKLGDALQATRAEAARRRAAVSECEERIHALERRGAALQATIEATRAALGGDDASAALSQAARPGIRGLVADHVRVEPGFETAVAALLGEWGDAVLAEDRDSALAALEHARRAALGHVAIVVAADPQPAAPGQSASSEPGSPDEGVWATRVVAAPEGVKALLRSVAVVPDLAAARRCADAGTAAVTRDGDVVRPQSLSGAGRRGAGRIELSAALAAAQTARRTLDADLAAQNQALTQARAAGHEAEEAEEAARAAVREEADAAAAARRSRDLARARHESARADARRAVAARDAAAAAVHTAAAEARAAAAVAEEAGRAVEPEPDRQALRQAQAAADAAQERDLAARLAVETARAGLKADRRAYEDLQARRRAQEEEIRRASARAARRRAQRERAVRVGRRLPALRAALGRAVTRAEDGLAEAGARRARHDAELAELRGRERTLVSRAQEVGEQAHRIDLRLHELDVRLAGCAERAGQVLGLSLADLLAEHGHDGRARREGEAAQEPFDRGREEALLARAQQDLARIGQVNPLALEEFRALEQRHAFLTEQLADLEATRKDLLAIIDDVDRRMQDLFVAAFEDTRRAFAEVLPLLFPGGSGTLELAEPERLLETGVDLVVRPAGKRVDRLSLLSGGERALAAVALLVAIFKARPSPFYVMDEIEAALDDANLGRLLDVFGDLRTSSQLIIITHQKRTMEVADALYGVAMQQDGVSAVVGQRLS